MEKVTFDRSVSELHLSIGLSDERGIYLMEKIKEFGNICMEKCVKVVANENGDLGQSTDLRDICEPLLELAHTNIEQAFLMFHSGVIVAQIHKNVREQRIREFMKEILGIDEDFKF
jgi:hypothetical protein